MIDFAFSTIDALINDNNHHQGLSECMKLGVLAKKKTRNDQVALKFYSTTYVLSKIVTC